MVLFISDRSAKGVLRALIRDASASIPKDLDAKVFNVLKKHQGKKPKYILEKLTDLFRNVMIAADIEFISGTALRVNIYLPSFQEDERGWIMRCQIAKISYIRTDVVYVLTETVLCPVAFTGHALERLFQRQKILSWSDVRMALRTSFFTLNLWYLASRVIEPKQIILPAAKGCFIGVVEYVERDDGHPLRSAMIKTFVERPGRVMDAAKDLLGIFTGSIVGSKFKDAVDIEQGMVCNKMIKLLDDHPWLNEEYHSIDDN